MESKPLPDDSALAGTTRCYPIAIKERGDGTYIATIVDLPAVSAEASSAEAALIQVRAALLEIYNAGKDLPEPSPHEPSQPCAPIPMWRRTA